MTDTPKITIYGWSTNIAEQTAHGEDGLELRRFAGMVREAAAIWRAMPLPAPAASRTTGW